MTHTMCDTSNQIMTSPKCGLYNTKGQLLETINKSCDRSIIGEYLFFYLIAVLNATPIVCDSG